MMSFAGEQQLQKTLDGFLQLHPKKIDLSLSRIENFLRKLNNPETKLPPVIHVAGTNGKGSVVAFLRSILEGAGLRVHVYTSPHLVSFRERIRLAGRLIDPLVLIDILKECETANGGAPITFFEMTTAAAFLAFSRIQADVCILEVGLGGRLDATNVIAKPLCSIITPVGLDHAEFLGNTMESIAVEKASICKPRTPLVVGFQHQVVIEAIQKVAVKNRARLISRKQAWVIEKTKSGYVFNGLDRHILIPELLLSGYHQVENAGLAIASLLSQALFEISDNTFQTGLRKATWPARFQTLDQNAFSLPNATVWLDGGHNPLAAEALASLLKKEKDPDRPLHLIIGMMANKDPKGFLQPLARYVDTLFAVPIEGNNHALMPQALCEVAQELGLKAETASNVTEASKRIKDRYPQVLITGSLYLAGNVLKHIGWQPK